MNIKECTDTNNKDFVILFNWYLISIVISLITINTIYLFLTKNYIPNELNIILDMLMYIIWYNIPIRKCK